MSRLRIWAKKIKAKLPTQEKIFSLRGLKPFARFLNKDYYWQFTRHNVALAVAVGLFVGFLPAPQIIPAFIGAYLVRANLAVTVFTSFYSNIFTYIPLTYAAYRVGEKILTGGSSSNNLSLYEVSNWSFHHFYLWVQEHLSYLLVGIPVLGTVLAVIGYVTVVLLWNYNHKQKKA